MLYSPTGALNLSGGGGAAFAGTIWVASAKVTGQLPITRVLSLEAGALRTWLTDELLRIAANVSLALQQSDPLVRNAMLEAVIDDVNALLLRMDGSVGGDSRDDWIPDPERQQPLVAMLRDLIERLDSQLVAIPGLPPQAP